MAVGMIDGLKIWPGEDVSLKRLLQHTDGGMAATDIVRFGEELLLEIRKTVIHEIAHHFGFNERDLERFESVKDPFRDGFDYEGPAADERG